MIFLFATRRNEAGRGTSTVTEVLPLNRRGDRVRGYSLCKSVAGVLLEEGVTTGCQYRGTDGYVLFVRRLFRNWNNLSVSAIERFVANVSALKLVLNLGQLSIR